MIPSSYTAEQQIRTELAERRAQAAEARLARLACTENRPERRRRGLPLVGVPWQLARRLMRQLAGRSA